MRIDRRRKFHATVVLRALQMTTEDLLNYFYRKDTIVLDGRKAAKLFQPDHLLGLKATRDVRHPETNELIVKEGRKFTKLASAPDGAGRHRADPDHGRRGDRPRLGARREGPEDRRGAARLQRGDHRGEARAAPPARHRPHRGALPRRHAHRPGAPQHAAAGQDRRPAGGHPRDLPPAASRRSADARDRHHLLQQPVLQSRALRPVARRPAEAQPQAQAERAARAGHAAPRGHPRGRALPDRAEERQRADRRHRPPRQPPRARGRRAGGEPVPHRSRPHGARHQGAHEPAGHRDADAAGAHQLQAGVGGHQGVLRVLAALAVHGPDEPALGDHAQAAALRARPRRSHARARRLRGARRAPDPLRPRVPDRDAGRSEHRPDRVALDLRAGQRLRLRRDARTGG